MDLASAAQHPHRDSELSAGPVLHPGDRGGDAGGAARGVVHHAAGRARGDQPGAVDSSRRGPADRNADQGDHRDPFALFHRPADSGHGEPGGAGDHPDPRPDGLLRFDLDGGKRDRGDCADLHAAVPAGRTGERRWGHRGRCGEDVPLHESAHDQKRGGDRARACRRSAPRSPITARSLRGRG